MNHYCFLHIVCLSVSLWILNHLPCSWSLFSFIYIHSLVFSFFASCIVNLLVPHVQVSPSDKLLSSCHNIRSLLVESQQRKNLCDHILELARLELLHDLDDHWLNMIATIYLNGFCHFLDIVDQPIILLRVVWLQVLREVDGHHSLLVDGLADRLRIKVVIDFVAKVSHRLPSAANCLFQDQEFVTGKHC